MVLRLYEAFKDYDPENPTSVLQTIQETYLVGQDRDEVFRAVFEEAALQHQQEILEAMLHFDYSLVPSVRRIHVDELWPGVVENAAEDGCKCLLHLFLARGLGIRQTFGDQGDVLLWAVRVRDIGVVEDLLERGVDPNRSKVCLLSWYSLSVSSLGG